MNSNYHQILPHLFAPDTDQFSLLLHAKAAGPYSEVLIYFSFVFELFEQLVFLGFEPSASYQIPQSFRFSAYNLNAVAGERSGEAERLKALSFQSLLPNPERFLCCLERSIRCPV